MHLWLPARPFEASWDSKISAIVAYLCFMFSHLASLGLVFLNYLDRVLRECGSVQGLAQPGLRTSSHFHCIAFPKASYNFNLGSRSGEIKPMYP